MKSSSPRDREPIQKPWIWIVLGVIILASVPWYWPPGTVHPLVLGVPLWALVAAVGSVVLCGYLSWVCATQWGDDGEEE